MNKQKIDYVTVLKFKHNGKWVTDVTLFRGEKCKSYFNIKPNSAKRILRVMEKLTNETLP